MTPPEPLSPRARSLLDAARDELGPDDAAIARMRARVLGGAAGGVGVAAAVKASAGGSLAAKLALATLFVAALGGGVYLATRDSSPPSSRPVESVASPATPPSLPASIEAAPARPARPELPPPETVVAPVTPAPRRPAARPAAPRPAAGSSLADEVALVDDAMAALRNDDASAALAAADDHVTRFGRKGQLAEEAAAIRVEALCRLGDGRWSAAFDDFDARYPRSAQRPRLSAACKGVQ